MSFGCLGPLSGHCTCTHLSYGPKYPAASLFLHSLTCGPNMSSSTSGHPFFLGSHKEWATRHRTGNGRRGEGAAAGRHREEVAGGPRVGYSGDLSRAGSERRAQLPGDGRRARLPRRARPRGLLAPRARRAHGACRLPHTPHAPPLRAFEPRSDSLCWLLLPVHGSRAQDAQGRWHAGAIAAAVDNMCSAVAFTVEGAPTATVLYSLSHFSPAHPDVRARARPVRSTVTRHQIFRFLPSPFILRHLFRPQSQEEVEMEGRVVSRKGKLTSAAVEVRKKESGELIAIGRQWITRITPAWATKSNKSSKL